MRYAFSVDDGINESYIGPWNPYSELGEQFHPTVQLPLDAQRRGRNLFRQFRDGAPELIARLDGQATTYIDRNA